MSTAPFDLAPLSGAPAFLAHVPQADRGGRRMTAKRLAAMAQRKAAAESRWTPDAIALLHETFALGLGPRACLPIFEERFPGRGWTVPIIGQRRRSMGLVMVDVQRWRPEEVKILRSMRLNGARPAAIVAAIKRETGIVRSIREVECKAFYEGISARENERRTCLSALARRLDIDRTSLAHALKLLSIPYVNGGGMGRAVLLSPAAVATLEALFPAYREPVYNAGTAAHVLGVSKREVVGLFQKGVIVARCYGVRADWRVTKREIDRYLVPAFYRRPAATLPGIERRLGCEVQAARPLYIFARPDGILVIPAPNTKRVTYEKGRYIGRIVAAHGELVLVETIHGLVPCQPDDLDPANIADGPWEKYAAIVADIEAQQAERAVSVKRAPKVREPHPWRVAAAAAKQRSVARLA